MEYVIAILIYSVPALIVMGLVRMAGVRNRWGLLAAAAAGGGLAGAFIGSAVSALATAVDPGAAALRGGLFGLAAGLTAGGLILGLGILIARMK